MFLFIRLVKTRTGPNLSIRTRETSLGKSWLYFFGALPAILAVVALPTSLVFNAFKANLYPYNRSTLVNSFSMMVVRFNSIIVNYISLKSDDREDL